jgi:hypothetical protein
MVSKVTEYSFSNNKLVIDIEMARTISIQIIGGSGTRSLQGTNDGGAVTGSTINNAGDATNFSTIQAVKLSDGTSVTSITDAGLYKIDPVAFQYLQIGDGSTAAATKILVYRTFGTGL